VFHLTVFPSLFGEHSKTGKTRSLCAPIVKSQLIPSMYCWETVGYGKKFKTLHRACFYCASQIPQDFNPQDFSKMWHFPMIFCRKRPILWISLGSLIYLSLMNLFDTKDLPFPRTVPCASRMRGGACGKGGGWLFNKWLAYQDGWWRQLRDERELETYLKWKDVIVLLVKETQYTKIVLKSHYYLWSVCSRCKQNI
jgi:hypothetical protein